MVPRWRTVRATVDSGELGSNGIESYRANVASPERIDAEFAKAVKAWQSTASVDAADDLVASAIVLGKDSMEARSAAEALLSRAEAPSASKLLAEHLLRGRQLIASHNSELSQYRLRVLVGASKLRLSNNLSNPLLMAETALYYSMMGQYEPGARLLFQARALAPDDRYVVRASVRFFSHFKDRDGALTLARKIPEGTRDPWVQAARLGALHVAGRSPERLRTILSSLEDGDHNPFDVSELNSVVGTAMIGSGDHKRARKRFKESLLSPTENAVAQAEWAQRTDSAIRLPERVVAAPEAHEARTWLAFRQGNWIESAAAAEGWMALEPLDPSPFIFGSFLSAALLDNPARAVGIALHGLTANPDNVALLNNLAVAHASLNEPVHAQNYLDRAKQASPDPETWISINATQGLIRFRQGEFVAGVQDYLAAFDVAARLKLPTEALRALAYLAVEMSKYDAVHANFIAEAAEKQARFAERRNLSVDPDTMEMLKRAKSADAATETDELLSSRLSSLSTEEFWSD